MSWIIGTISKNKSLNPDLKKQIQRLIPEHIHAFESDKLLIYSGGIKETCFYGSDAESTWFCNGLGIDISDSSNYKIVSQPEWHNRITENNYSALNGHYLTVRYYNNTLEFRNDELGLRSVYIYELEETFLFSTRLDWLVKLIPSPQIDYEVFATHLLSMNPLSYKCFIKDVIKMGPNEKNIISNVKLNIERRPYTVFGKTKKNFDKLEQILSNFTRLMSDSGQKVSLGLSGGMDSRLLLGLLLKNSSHKFSAHTFGEEHNPDVYIPVEMSKKLGFSHQVLYKEFTSINNTLKEARDFVYHTQMRSVPSVLRNQLYFKELYSQGFSMIDGGMGDLMRRAVANRIILDGRSYFKDKNYDEIAMMFRKPVPLSIFNPDIQKSLVNSVKSCMKNEADKLPDLSEGSYGDWFDVMRVKYLMPNSASLFQAHMDSILPNFMPYLQPVFLKEVFAFSEKERNDSKLSRSIVKRNYPELRKFTQGRYGTNVPYGSGLYKGYIFARIQHLKGKLYVDNRSADFLNTISEYLTDKINSLEVKNNSLYDYRIISDWYNKFKTGERSHAANIEKWLMLEFWQELIRE